MTHTPGEWKVYNDHPGAPDIHYVRTNPSQYIGEVAVLFGANNNARADAHLIAAAPALLALARQYASECATCKGTGFVTRQYGGDGYGDRCAALADADDQVCQDCEGIHDVISKAEGKS